MSTVSAAEFEKQVREQERINFTMKQGLKGEFKSYSAAYPKPISDDGRFPILAKRLVSLLPKGSWKIAYPNGETIHNRNIRLGNIRFETTTKSK